MESSHLFIYAAAAVAGFAVLALLWMILGELKSLNHYVRKSAGESSGASSRSSSGRSSRSSSSSGGGSRSSSGH